MTRIRTGPVANLTPIAALLAVILLSAACTNAGNGNVATGPGLAGRLAETPPILYPAARYVQMESTGVLAIGWLEGTAIRVQRGAGPAVRPAIPTEAAPRDLLFLPGLGADTHALWIAGAGAAARLYNARLDSNLTLMRGPIATSTQETSTYAAAPLRTGEALALWTARTPGLPARPLFLQIIDSQGRPHTPARVADDAALVAVSNDGAGRLHAAWLEPQVGGTYAIRYAQISDAGLDSALISDPVIVGVIFLARDPAQVVERLRIGTTGDTVAIVWGLVAPATERGVIQALLFEPQTALRESIREVPIAQNARWPALPPAQPIRAPGNGPAALPISLTQFGPGTGGAAGAPDRGTPALILLTNAGIRTVTDFRAQAASSDLIGATAVDYGPTGQLSVIWAGVSAGSSGIFAAQATP